MLRSLFRKGKLPAPAAEAARFSPWTRSRDVRDSVAVGERSFSSGMLILARAEVPGGLLPEVSRATATTADAKTSSPSRTATLPRPFPPGGHCGWAGGKFVMPLASPSRSLSQFFGLARMPADGARLAARSSNALLLRPSFSASSLPSPSSRRFSSPSSASAAAAASPAAPSSSSSPGSSSEASTIVIGAPPPKTAMDLAAPSAPFRLSPNFVARYRDTPPPFGFNGLGQLVYRRTYARFDPATGEFEEWWRTVERVVNGCYNMQRGWIEQHRLGWNAWKAQRSAQEMYARIFSMKFLPPGRGLWAMGSAITEEKGLYAALNNCAFVSTETMREDPPKPFAFLMDAAMLGVGVGFDTKGAGTVTVRGPSPGRDVRRVKIADSREGWVASLRMLLESYFSAHTHASAASIEFDYSGIRPAGEPIRGFGGVSSGPDALVNLHERVRAVLDPLVGEEITVTAIVDLMNHIGKCVVSGNVRQTAEIAFGDPHSEEYIDLKNYAVNPHRADYGWTSNNSVFAELGMDYGPICERVATNGEPGFAWLDNMRQYGRMDGVPDNRDARASGGNPCLEQTLESYEMCCLVETFPANHDSYEDFRRTLKFAYLYAKTVTLGQTHWPETNRVLLRNRRIGCSMSGIAQFIARNGIEELRTWCDRGYAAIRDYDTEYSEWLAIPRSIKTTSVKPSGTVSLLAGATPGIHYPESRFYIRRMRLSAQSELVAPLVDAGYRVVPAVNEPNTAVVEFPIDVGEGVRTVSELSMWEQLCLAAFMQRWWSDNQVSATITFDPETEGKDLAHALSFFQYQLKGVSLLPRLSKDDAARYPQMPYEAITEEEYNERLAETKELVLPSSPSPSAGPIVNEVAEKFCDADSCTI